MAAQNTRNLADIAAELRRRTDALVPAVTETGGIRADAALRRYREGMTTEARLRTELALLGWMPEQIARLVLVGNLDYEYDRISDLIAAYILAYTNAQIEEADLREYLSDLGLVAERIEDYVLSAKVKRVGKVKPVKPPKEVPYYKSEAGKVRLTSLKYAFREGVITTEELRRGLLELGMSTDLADALADYEELRRPVE